jgi:cytochrome c oxidase cbb3-type subunit 3
MSDFVSGFWNMYVIVIVLVSIFACALLSVHARQGHFHAGQDHGSRLG